MQLTTRLKSRIQTINQTDLIVKNGVDGCDRRGDVIAGMCFKRELRESACSCVRDMLDRLFAVGIGGWDGITLRIQVPKFLKKLLQR